MKNKTAYRYILSQLIPSYMIGFFTFIALLLIFQALRLTELILIKGINLSTLLELIFYLTLSLLPAILPMSVLFAVLFTYSRLNADSEFIAFRTLGLTLKKLCLPALALALVISILCFQISFYIGPWGNRQFELLVYKLKNTKITQNLKSGSFSENFYDLVLFSKKVQPDLLEDIFIYDERILPLSIIAQKGEIIESKDRYQQPTILRLKDGAIYFKEKNIRIQFDDYDIYFSNALRDIYRHKSLPSLTLNDINTRIEQLPKDSKNRIPLEIEWHKRLTLSLACLTFAFLGIGIGSSGHRRGHKSNGFMISIGVTTIYWIFYMIAENMAKKMPLPPALIIWTISLCFLAIGIRSLQKINRL